MNYQAKTQKLRKGQKCGSYQRAEVLH